MGFVYVKRLRERWPLLMVFLGLIVVFATSRWPDIIQSGNSQVVPKNWQENEGSSLLVSSHKRNLLVRRGLLSNHEMMNATTSWYDVCATENRRMRAMFRRRQQQEENVSYTFGVLEPLVLRLRGGDSRNGIPLSMLDESKIFADVAPGLTARIFIIPTTEKKSFLSNTEQVIKKQHVIVRNTAAEITKISCKSTAASGQAKIVHADYSHCQESSRKLTSSSRGHKRHRGGHASSCIGKAQSVKIIGLACNAKNKEIARIETETSIIPRSRTTSSNIPNDCTKGRAAYPPIPTNPEPLLTLLDGSRDEDILNRAAKNLENYLNDRGTVCSASHKCKVNILDKKCPNRLLCNGHEPSMNPEDDINIAQRIKDAPPCLFTAAISSANLLRYEEIDDYCVEICIPRKLVTRAASSTSVSSSSSSSSTTIHNNKKKKIVLPRWFHALEMFGDKQIFYDAAENRTTKNNNDATTISKDYVCYVAHMHALAIWWAEHASGNPTGDADPPKGKNEAGIFSKATLRTKSDPEILKLNAKELDTCAIVASGHSLRCSSKSWGPVIDNGYYDAVFKMNKLQFANESVYNSLECDYGRRADFIVNFFPETTQTPHVGIHLQPTLDLVRRLGSVLLQKSPVRYKAALSVFDLINLDVAMPIEDSRDRAIGKSSGTAALAVALSMCKHVDAYGFGVFRSDAAHRSTFASSSDVPYDFRYLHIFHSLPTPESPNLAHDLLASELRNALFHAYGIANMVWW